MKLKPNILKLVDDYQYKRAICYAKTDERIYCNLKTVYIIGFIYQALIMFLLTYGQYKTHYLDGNNIFAFSIMSFGLFAIAFILMFFKLDIISLPLNITATALLWPIMKEVLFLSGAFHIKNSFYFKHLIPLALILIASIWMCIISTRERYLIKRDYKAVMEKLYRRYRTDEMSDSEWEEFIDNYKETEYTEEKTVK